MIYKKCIVAAPFVHNVINRNMLMNDIKRIKGSSKEIVEIVSGSAIITISVIQIPSKGLILALSPYNQNFPFYL